MGLDYIQFTVHRAHLSSGSEVDKQCLLTIAELNIPLEEVGVGEHEMQPPSLGLQDDKEVRFCSYLLLPALCPSWKIN